MTTGIRKAINQPKSRRTTLGDKPSYAIKFGLGMRFLALSTVMSVAGAQSLDEQIRRLLARDAGENYCAQLLGSSPRDSQTLRPLNFGPQLASICGNVPPPPEPPVGSGPGAPGSTVSGAAFSALGQADQILKKRRAQRNQDQGPANGSGAGDSAELALTSSINLFFNGDYRELDRRQTAFEQGYTSSEKGFSLGADIMPTDWLIAGMAFSYSHWRGDQFNGGGFETDSYGPTLFASLLPWRGLFADLSFQYLRKDGANNNRRDYAREDRQRFGGVISGTPGADQYEGNFSTGYDFNLGGFSIGPRATLRYRHVNMEGYSEQGGSGLELRFLGDRLTSLQSSVGAQASYAIGTAWGVLVPQINVDWTHEYDNGQRLIFVQFAQDNRLVPTTFGFQTDRPDRDFFHLGTGLVAVLPNGWQAFANFETLLGHSYFDNYVGSVGVRLGL